MLVDIAPLQLTTLLIIGFTLFGPEKSLGAIRPVVDCIRTLRRLSDKARQDLHAELDPELKSALAEISAKSSEVRQLLSLDGEYRTKDPHDHQR